MNTEVLSLVALCAGGMIDTETFSDALEILVDGE